MNRGLSLVLFLAAAGLAPAQLLAPPDAPFSWLAGATNSTAHHWNNFATPGVGTYPGPFTPDQLVFAPGLAAATLTETTGTAFLTGGGNIYSPSTLSAFQVAVPGYGLSGGPWQTTVFVQTRTLGSEMDYSSLTISDGSNTLPAANAFLTQELERAPLGGFGGFSVTHLWGFQLAGSPSAMNLQFAAAGSSLSLDQVRIDSFVTSVPEPTSFVLAGMAGLLAAYRRRARS